MKFYFPDSQDQVSPTFDFLREEHSPYRVRQRDDLYAHEVLDAIPYDGMLVSKSIVDGMGGAGKYSEAQRNRLYRYGIRRFFRLPPQARTLGDCGAFTYVGEAEPPYTVSEVVDFYERCGFDEGISPDHIVLHYDRRLGVPDAPAEWRRRRALTLRLAADFLAECDDRGRSFQPVGVAHGWSPPSYADSVESLQKIGYTRIALGGMVPLKTPDIIASLEAVAAVCSPVTQLHLLGINRLDAVPMFSSFGVTSFDSTSPFRQAFMDEFKNYHTEHRTYVAIRIPQVDGNAALKRRILAGHVDQRAAVQAERRCLDAVRDVAYGGPVPKALAALAEYEAVLEPRRSYLAEYEQILDARPWEGCPCNLCRNHGIEIAMFRGSERNKRRGFHNLFVLARRAHADCRQ